MSQYPWPSPYEPGYGPPPGYDPVAHLLAPARRASWLSIILAVVLMACGACAGAFYFLPLDQLPPEQRAEFARMDDQIRAETGGMGLRAAMGLGGAVLLVPALLLLVLGIAVRNGSGGVAIALIVLTSLLLLLGLLNLVTSLPGVARDPRAAVGLCVVVIPIALLGLLMYYLIGAVRSAPQLRAVRAQYQSQYWQHQQTQQTYGQPWQGAPPPPPPPPPPAGNSGPPDVR
jgi:hypothetical protein